MNDNLDPNSVKPPQAEAKAVQAQAEDQSVKPPQVEAEDLSVKPPQVEAHSLKPPQ